MRAKHGAAVGAFSATKYDGIEDGLLNRDRGCTDVLCCGVFSLTMIALLAIGIYGFSAGNVITLLAQLDGEGHFCGIDYNTNSSSTEPVAEEHTYKYLYLPDLSGD